MFAFFATFSQRNRVLPLWSWFHVVLLVIALGMAVFDSRLVLSITHPNYAYPLLENGLEQT